ncbi:MAG: aspartyl/glutamyl-tRNA amidotransferase subunit C [Holophagales bacterium]|nr:aspartyl/glutamyl-tRNA amidotransferase subunit C [Holophagales bacterium]MYD21277.1 aspartyl/glutamyl-tRNA amidotransferase subunit C [Holophagales bacterium]MYI32531.1 aspartyl/glutamyl-tRNA amidotransferase subunit C [Holophagales bacterium]
MSLGVEEVRRIAELARLRISAREEATFAGQLSDIVDYIDQLREFDDGAASFEETETASDVADNDLPRPAAAAGPADLDETPLLDQFLDNAPASLDRFLLVPQVKATPGGDE